MPGFDTTGALRASVLSAETVAAGAAASKADVVVVLGVRDAAVAPPLQALTAGAVALVAYDCADAVAELQRIGEFKSAAEGVEAASQAAAVQLMPWAGAAQGSRLAEQAELLFSRHSSEDLLYAVFFIVHALVQELDIVRHTVSPTWEKGPLRNAQEFAAMCTTCSGEISAALSDPPTKATIDLLNACDMRDQVGSYRVIVSYETPQSVGLRSLGMHALVCRRLVDVSVAPRGCDARAAGGLLAVHPAEEQPVWLRRAHPGAAEGTAPAQAREARGRARESKAERGRARESERERGRARESESEGDGEVRAPRRARASSSTSSDLSPRDGVRTAGGAVSPSTPRQRVSSSLATTRATRRTRRRSGCRGAGRSCAAPTRRTTPSLRSIRSSTHRASRRPRCGAPRRDRPYSIAPSWLSSTCVWRHTGCSLPFRTRPA
eukprot:5060304-Prymnesium_polylepis.1